MVQKKTFTPDYLTHTKKNNHGEEAMIVLKNHHEPIIDRELWEVVQAELQKRNRRQGGGHANRYLFSGKIKCGECGASFVSRKKKRQNGTGYQCWCCYTAATEGKRRQNAQGIKTGCDIGKTVRSELALELLRQSIDSLQISREQIINHLTAVVMDALRAEDQKNHDTSEKLERERERLTQKKIDALDAFLSGTIPETDWGLIDNRYKEELESLQTRQEKLRAFPKTTFSRKDIQQKITAVINGSAASEIYCKNILDRMTVYKDKRIEVRLALLPQKWTYALDPF